MTDMDVTAKIKACVAAIHLSDAAKLGLVKGCEIDGHTALAELSRLVNTLRANNHGVSLDPDTEALLAAHESDVVLHEWDMGEQPEPATEGRQANPDRGDFVVHMRIDDAWGERGGARSIRFRTQADRFFVYWFDATADVIAETRKVESHLRKLGVHIPFDLFHWDHP